MLIPKVTCYVSESISSNSVCSSPNKTSYVRSLAASYKMVKVLGRSSCQLLCIRGHTPALAVALLPKAGFCTKFYGQPGGYENWHGFFIRPDAPSTRILKAACYYAFYIAKQKCLFAKSSKIPLYTELQKRVSRARLYWTKQRQRQFGTEFDTTSFYEIQ